MSGERLSSIELIPWIARNRLPPPAASRLLPPPGAATRVKGAPGCAHAHLRVKDISALQVPAIMSGRAGAPSRDQAAFQWLLSREDEDEDGRRQQGGRSRSGGQQGRRRSSGREGRLFIPGFQLREESEGRGAATAVRGSGGAAAGPPALAALQEAFAALLPPDVVSDVLAACGGDSAAASEALLGMAGGGAGGDEAPATAAAAAPAAAEQTPPSVPGLGGPCYLHLLPEEIKQLIFDQLSLRCVR